MKHGWNSIKNFLDLHDSYLQKYCTAYSDFDHRYEIDIVDDKIIMSCIGILITTYSGKTVRCDITKVAVKDFTGTKARTVSYQYNANIPGVGNLFRYCSPDLNTNYDPNDHHTFHHKHEFRTGSNIVTPTSPTDWPHVSEFFDEVLQVT